MERIPVSSSNIAAIGFELLSETLEVEFKNGSIYQYFNVPEVLFEQLMAATSVGAFFNANIRDAFGCQRA